MSEWGFLDFKSHPFEEDLILYVNYYDENKRSWSWIEPVEIKAQTWIGFTVWDLTKFLILSPRFSGIGYYKFHLVDPTENIILPLEVPLREVFKDRDHPELELWIGDRKEVNRKLDFEVQRLIDEKERYEKLLQELREIKYNPRAIPIVIKNLSGGKKEIAILPEWTAGYLRELLAELSYLPSHQIRILHRGSPLYDKEILGDLQLNKDNTIYTVLNAYG